MKGLFINCAIATAAAASTVAAGAVILEKRLADEKSDMTDLINSRIQSDTARLVKQTWGDRWQSEAVCKELGKVKSSCISAAAAALKSSKAAAQSAAWVEDSVKASCAASEAARLEEIRTSCASYAAASHEASTAAAETAARVATQATTIHRTAEDVRQTASDFLRDIDELLQEQQANLNVLDSTVAAKQNDQDTKIEKIDARLQQFIASKNAKRTQSLARADAIGVEMAAARGAVKAVDAVEIDAVKADDLSGDE
jgi:hypothetical protein